MEAVVAHARRDVLTEGVEYFDPEHYLIDIIRRAIANRQDILVSAEGIGHITVLSARGEYFPSVSDLIPFCKTPADRLKVEVLKPSDSRLPQAGTIGSNIDELLWFTAFHISEGRLMEGCYRDDVVQLSLWPNLTRLPKTANSVRISALLTRYPTSISFACRLLGVDRTEMFQFYSAARCAGFARALNRKPEEPALLPHRNKGLLSLLLGKIADL